MYKCIFFDLDHTLWDYETNSRETLQDLYVQYALQDLGVTVEGFQQRFREVNTQLWDLYDRGEIDSGVIRKERFKQILEHFHAYEVKLSQNLSDDYLECCPKKAALMPHAIDVLDYLSGKYNLTVVTNGFEEIQHMKLTSGNLHRYFDFMVTSQKAGYKKPAREIFEFALKSNSVAAEEALMIGDNLITDIGGARNASIDTTFYNPDNLSHNEVVKYEIKSLIELCDIL
jgi:putative hydrolase of the HAD superfamily